MRRGKVGGTGRRKRVDDKKRLVFVGKVREERNVVGKVTRQRE